MTDPGSRINEAMRAICDEIPARLGIQSIMLDAHKRLAEACPEHPEFVTEKLAEVLREIATVAVEELTRRTGEPFLWVDDPAQAAQDGEPLMSLALDETWQANEDL